ncbi:hypothetical protein KK083_10015 [Fulvivirgaceae bacterium PWU4]|uniref:DUF885 domain-containing protein n=1 Tax=Chryseosolibacter histidini TaxID=2782349 RepID=A0AAP2DJ12_9BACT|nr:hypothetical protein [Chryseosolibacter histidini]MBT1697211.1 hypothetical protein [Chryseosolibacter histidini]
MERIGIIASLMVVVAFSAYSQHAQGTLVAASVSGADRLSIVKNSISIPAWHEKSFWSVYEDYLGNVNEVSTQGYRSLETLAEADKNTNGAEAYELGQQMIKDRRNLLALRERYYTQIGAGFNGIIALQFLQAEALLDMMESCRIYEQTHWSDFRFHPKALNPSQFKKAKHNTIHAALTPSVEEASAFWEVYNRYEEECDALLGEDYSLISLYAGDPSDFTPAIAKRLGNDFLSVMQRELKLKEKYFVEMNQVVGPSLATRFLAWEDYYSLVSKMYAWAEQ